VFFAIGLAYNLYLGFRGVAFGKEWERAQVQTVRWQLFQTAGKIVRYGRQLFLKISVAMLDAFAAIRERCARIMREGGAIPETSGSWLQHFRAFGRRRTPRRRLRSHAHDARKRQRSPSSAGRGRLRRRP
jgi:hypothetical protein